MVDLNEIQMTISNYFDRYNDEKTLDEIEKELSYAFDGDLKTNILIQLEVFHYISNNESLRIDNNKVIRIMPSNKVHCTMCAEAIDCSKNNGDMFDCMRYSIFCKKLNEYVCKNATLEESYQIDNSFCPKLKK